VRRPKREWRFDVKSELAAYLGDPSESVRGALVYFPSTGAILTRGDVIHSPYHLKISATTIVRE
jgi:hypothetical protein